jgi:predicted RNA methylase
MRATYSPDDNKLRLYPANRLDEGTYAEAKALGFKWAPKQQLFVAPMWTPQREDFLTSLAGEIEDEDTSLSDRAAERADRFDGFSERRAKDAVSARAAVAEISDNIPLGQPILIGHHSERHARKHAQQIERGMERAVKMWETSKYWEDRAAGAIAHAKYKERPDVRARRIKTIEADKRKSEKAINESRQQLDWWNDQKLTKELATKIAGAYTLYGKFPVADFPRTKEGASPYEGDMTYYYALQDDIVTMEYARDRYIKHHTRRIAWQERWLQHYNNRLTYEKAMLAESGYVEPPKRPTKAVLPLLNYSGMVIYQNPYRRGETVTAEAVPMTKDEFARIHKDYKGTRISADGTHRVRTAMVKGSLCMVYLTDQKQHVPPGREGADAAIVEKAEKAQKKIKETFEAISEAKAHNRALVDRHDIPSPGLAGDTKSREALDKEMQALKQQAKAGVQVVSAEQLFPTPPHVAEQMVDLADIERGMRVLEPSAGTGRILDALPDYCYAIAVEINQTLANALKSHPAGVAVVTGDFLCLHAETLDGKFDRILMNPPFKNGDDIKHIKHALSMLNDGGVLVAICAGGPRQERELQPLATVWERLPDNTFAEEGTGVNTVMVRIDK